MRVRGHQISACSCGAGSGAASTTTSGAAAVAALRSLLHLLLIFQAGTTFTDACTNLIVTPGASTDGATLYSYAADSAGLYGSLGRYKKRENIPAGTVKKIYDWDSGMYLGEIPEPTATYDVVGNMNEYQLTIGETTFGGVPILTQGQPGAVMDYGNLIWTTLQRAKTVQEALQIMPALVEKKGYASEGESFTLADPTEVWILEMIGKGKYEKGAVWVAVKVPDGHVAGHANQARITTFDVKDTANCRAAPDVESFATKVGLYDPSKGEPFNWAQAYDPISFTGARWSDARVWSFFSRVTSIPDFEKKYEKYVLGANITSATTRMPLSVPVKKKLAAKDLMLGMRNSFEDSALKMNSDVGMGPWRANYRDRPLSWSYSGESYANERSIGTQQTAWHFVAEMRHWLPNEVGGVFWFGVDDTRFSVHIPFYAFATVPKALENPGLSGGESEGGNTNRNKKKPCTRTSKTATGVAASQNIKNALSSKRTTASILLPTTANAKKGGDKMTLEPVLEDEISEELTFEEQKRRVLARTEDRCFEEDVADEETTSSTGQAALDTPSSSDINTFSFTSLFWLNQLVANRVYAQWDILAPIVSKEVQTLEAAHFELQRIIEKQALGMKNRNARSAFLSAESTGMTMMTVKRWQELWVYLTVTYRDGVKVLPAQAGHDHGGSDMGGPVADVVQGSGVGNNEWSDEWKARIVAEAGDHFRIPKQVLAGDIIKGGSYTTSHQVGKEEPAHHEELHRWISQKEAVVMGKERNARTTVKAAALAEMERLNRMKSAQEQDEGRTTSAVAALADRAAQIYI